MITPAAVRAAFEVGDRVEFDQGRLRRPGRIVEFDYHGTTGERVGCWIMFEDTPYYRGGREWRSLLNIRPDKYRPKARKLPPEIPAVRPRRAGRHTRKSQLKRQAVRLAE